MSRLFDELRRRHVIHTAIGYVIAAYAAVEVVLNVVDVYELPKVWVQYLVAALGVGFFPVVAVSWYYEWSAGGLRRDEDQEEIATRNGSRKADHVTGTLLIAALAYIAWDLVEESEPGYALSKMYPLSTAPGLGIYPAISNDGNYVAFALHNEGQSDVYVQGIDSVDPVRLTDTVLKETTPAFSPDGTEIAFIRRLGDEGRHVVVKPKLGGAERVVYKSDWDTFVLGLDWSPDGRFLVFPGQAKAGNHETSAIFRLSLATGEIVQLTQPTRGVTVRGSHEVPLDGWPKVSPDGQQVAFARDTGSSWMICLVGIDGAREGCLEDTSNSEIWIHDWLPDSRRLLLVTEDQFRSNVRTLVQVSSRTGKVEPFHDMPTVFHVTVSKQADRVVLMSLEKDQSLWRIRGPNSETAGQPEKITTSKQNERWPHVSDDGSKVVFWTDQSGTGIPEIWTANIDGSDARRVTSDINGNYPRLSPNGQWIAYSGAPYDNTETGQKEVPINVVDIDGGVGRRVVDRGAVPTWSNDGQSLYFMYVDVGDGPCPSGFRISRQPISGGTPEPLVDCGIRPVEGPDERLYYVTRDDDVFTLFSVPLLGGPPRLEVERVNAYFWDLSDKHLVYVDKVDNNLLKVRELATGATRSWSAPFEDRGIPPTTANRSLSVSRNGNWIVFTKDTADWDFWKTTLVQDK